MTDLIQRPRRLRKSPALRAMFEETTLSLNDLVLPIFVEEEIFGVALQRHQIQTAI